jgi:glutaredoxin
MALSGPSFVLYTREGCHLCHEAEQLLNRYGVPPELVDIDVDSALSSQFGECVPVLMVDGKIRFRGKINEVLLRRLLAQINVSDGGSA